MKRSRSPLVAGVCFGLAFACLAAAYFAGKVTDRRAAPSAAAAATRFPHEAWPWSVRVPRETVKNVSSTVDGAGCNWIACVENAARMRGIKELDGVLEWAADRPGGHFDRKVREQLAAFAGERGRTVPAYELRDSWNASDIIDQLARHNPVIVSWRGGEGTRYGSSVQSCVVVVGWGQRDEGVAIFDPNWPDAVDVVPEKTFLRAWKVYSSTRADDDGWVMYFRQAPVAMRNVLAADDDGAVVYDPQRGAAEWLTAVQFAALITGQDEKHDAPKGDPKGQGNRDQGPVPPGGGNRDQRPYTPPYNPYGPAQPPDRALLGIEELARVVQRLVDRIFQPGGSADQLEQKYKEALARLDTAGAYAAGGVVTNIVCNVGQTLCLTVLAIAACVICARTPRLQQPAATPFR
jgi:hypothetical protein